MMRGPHDRAEYVVRAASHADLGAMADLRWQWRVVERGESATSHDGFVEAFVEWCTARWETHRGVVAEVDGVMVGIGWLAVVERVPGPAHRSRRSGYVQSVYVTPDCRGAGIGGAIVAQLVDMARSSGMDYLAVHPSEMAFSLYRRAGFSETPAVLELRWG